MQSKMVMFLDAEMMKVCQLLVYIGPRKKKIILRLGGTISEFSFKIKGVCACV